MTRHRHSGQADLFLVRVWAEAQGGDGGEPVWRGKVQRTVSGETYPFTGWQGLLDVMLAMVSDKGGDRGHGHVANITRAIEDTSGLSGDCR